MSCTMHINTIPQELNLQEIEESVFQRLTSTKLEWLVTLIHLSFDGVLTLIKSSLIKFTTSLNIYIAGLKRPQERGNAVTALLVHSEGRIFRRQLVCNLKGEEMPGRKRVAR